jgi:uncharacterized membrane protein YtjA (UPF0391 family)
MLLLVAVILTVAIVAGLLGLTGVAATATNIVWFVIIGGLILALVASMRGNRPL